MSKEAEEYRDVKGFEGVYQISNLGNVKSLSRLVEWRGVLRPKKETLLKPSPNSDGYMQVVLNYNKKKKSLKVHQLIAIAFLGHEPCGLDLVVDHINNDKLDNRVENLQLISHRENVSKDKKSSSGCIGVSWDKSRSKWTVGIRHKGIKVNLGRFDDLQEAVLTSNRAYVLEANNINPKLLKCEK